MPLKGYGSVIGFTHMLEEAVQQINEHLLRQKQNDGDEPEGFRIKLTPGMGQVEVEVIEETKKRRKNEYPVVVVGCGASGIAALSKLAEAGVKAIGLEASHRIGGRICTVDFGANVVDIGAAWCHGEVNNLVYNLANPYDLLGRPEPLKPGTRGDWFIYSDGSLMPHGNAEEALKAIQKSVNGNTNSSRSISEFVRTGVKNNSIKTNPAVKHPIPIKEPFLELYERDNHIGGEINPKTAKSLKGLKIHEACPGEFWLNWKGKGYKSILDVLMGTHPAQTAPTNPIVIEHGKEVTNICYVVPNPDPQDPVPTVLVTCSDGSVMKASRVIVTVSLGVLKERHLTMFTPPLPADKVSAINNLQFCVLDKIYIRFRAPWWPEGLTNFKILWRDEDKEKFEESEKWVTGIYGLRAVEHQPNVLLAWLYGTNAEAMEKVDEEAVLRGVNKLLKIFMLNFKVTPVTDIKRSTWASDQFIRGAYSYRAVTTEEAGTGAEAFHTPVGPSGALHFAGEATSKRWHNAVHGAIDAGYRAADDVIKAAQV